jgi:archaellum biogenesis ATPase FlaH
MEGAVDTEYDFYAPQNVIRSSSPSLNWVFGRGNGLPFGLSVIAFGPPKAGKSLVSNLMVAGLHKDFKDAIAIKFNTEMREGAQFSIKDQLKWNIDPNRYQAYDVNKPELIFDKITNEIEPMLEQGMPLKLIIIDSLNGVEGVKAAKKESILDFLVGDHALTIGEGLKRILPIIRKYKIALICTGHIRANIDVVGNPKYQPKTKLSGGYQEKHSIEYYLEVNRDNSSESKITDEKIKDLKDNSEIIGHKIYCKMTESSTGVAGRSGRFTIEYDKGLVGIEEEIYELSKSLNIVERPNNTSYVFGGKKYVGKEAFITAIKDDEKLRAELLKLIYSK